MTEKRPGPEPWDAAATLEAAFAAFSDGVIVTDGAGRVRSANDAARALLGEGAAVGALLEASEAVRDARTLDESEGRLTRRVRLTGAAGTTIVDLVSVPLAVGGGLRVHTLRDVTAQVELRGLKEDFLLQVAHELRSPIAALSASLDLLLQDALTMPRDQLAVMVRTLGRSATRLETLVENLLDAGSIEAGTFQVRALPTFLGGAVQTALGLVKPLLEARGQTVRVTVAREAETVIADPRRTAQVLANLLSNASKYSPDGAAITVGAEASGGFVTVTVRDDGPGIPHEEQAQVFDRFFRARAARSQAGGLGLGLAICRAIVQAQGGEIGITSEPGVGTSVHFTIPKARRRTEEAKHA